MTEREQVLERIQSADARAAFEYLVQEAGSEGFQIGYKVRGFVRAVELRDENGYVFAWIANVAHLLFYIRKPALKVASHLLQPALRHHDDKVNVNSAGEITIRIENVAEAERLLSWLLAEYSRRAA